MKKYLGLVAIVLFALSVGCSRLSVSGPTEITPTTTAVVSMVFNKNAELTKKTATTPVDENATYILVSQVNYAPGASPAVIDSIPITTSGTISTINRRYNLPRNQPYGLTVQALNDVSRLGSPTTQFNYGCIVGTVPNADSFNVAITCYATLEKVKFKVPIKGTIVQATACSVNVAWTELAVGRMLRNGSITTTFAPGTMDTVKVNDVLFFPVTVTNSGITTVYPDSFALKVTIYNTSGSSYSGIDSVLVSPSTNGSAIISLVYVASVNTLGKVLINFLPTATYTVSTSGT
jgi:hypothetical protein